MNLFCRQRKRQEQLKTVSTYKELKDRVQELLYAYTEKSVEDVDLENEVYKNQEEYRRVVSKCIRNCCSGNFGDRDTVLELLYSFLSPPLFPYDIVMQLLGKL